MKQHLSQDYFAYGHGTQQIPPMSTAPYYMAGGGGSQGSQPSKSGNPYMLGFSPVSSAFY